jgi:hypothetical protein
VADAGPETADAPTPPSSLNDQVLEPQPQDTPPPRRHGPVRRFFTSIVDRVNAQARRAFFAVRRLFGGGPPKRRARVYWDTDITLTLANLVSETETRASGKVQVITLAAFRDSIGELWERYKDNITIIAETSISRRIGKGNTFIALEDDSWLLLFARSAEPEAQARADAIAAAIGEKLMGARFSLEEMPLPGTAKLGLADILNDDGSIDLAAVRAEVGKIKTAQRAAYMAPIPKSAARLGKTKEPPRKTGRIPVVRARAIPGMPAADAPPPPTPAPQEEPSQIDDLTMLFRPAWNAETQSVNTFHFRATTTEGACVTDDDAVKLNNATALDLVRAALKAFTALRETDAPLQFVLPLPVNAFTIAGLVETQKLIAAIPREDRLGHLRLDLRRLPRANPEKLVALRELFRSYVRGVAFPINPFTPMDSMLAVDHVTYTVDVSRETESTDTQMFEALMLLKNRAGARPVVVTGLRKHGHLTRAVAAGVTEVSGPALMDDVKELPQRAQLLPRESLTGTM